jgi:hypothetical protein
LYIHIFYSRFIFFFHYFIMTGKTHTIGTRAQVWHGTAKKTSGGLLKSDLMMNKAGRIVSKAKHFTAKKEMRLVKHGYGAKKGKFGYVKIGTRKSRKMKGGAASLSPADVGSSYMIKDVVPQTFSPLDRALVGGKSRRRHRMRGGSGMAPLSPQGSASWNGDGISGAGITNFGSGSIGVQMEAGMSGGRRRRRKMRGGTMNRSHVGAEYPNAFEQSPLNRALNA